MNVAWRRRPRDNRLRKVDPGLRLRGYNTNLASEFYVLSTLYRLGLDANLTLGNKKSVDITVVRGPSDVITIDVKAVAKCMDWPMRSALIQDATRHFLVLLCYNNAFTDPARRPDAWVIPFTAIEDDALSKAFQGGMTCIIRSRLVKIDRYKEAWALLKARAAPEE
jgi:hypothetical protein